MLVHYLNFTFVNKVDVVVVLSTFEDKVIVAWHLYFDVRQNGVDRLVRPFSEQAHGRHELEVGLLFIDYFVANELFEGLPRYSE